MALPVVSISLVRTAEGTNGSNNYLVYEIVLSEAATGPVTLGWRSYPGGTASENDLYYGSEGNTLTIAAGRTTAYVSILLVGDSAVETDESVVLELSNVNGAVFAGNVDRLTATGVILDDDGTGEKRALLVSDAEVMEGDEGTREAVFTVRLSRPAETDLAFDYRTVDGTARAGEDYTALNGTLTFLAGQVEASVRVAVSGDTTAEAVEGFALIVRPQAESAAAIANGVEGSVGQGLVIDDDSGNGTVPVVSVLGAEMIEDTNGSNNYLVYEIVLSEAATSPVTLGWRSYPGGTASENDLYYGSEGNTLTIAAGRTTAYVSILLLGDSAVEADESVVLELSNVNGAVFAGGADRLTATGIILDDDGTGEKRALLVSDAEVMEGDEGTREAVFTVRLSRPAETDLAFDYRTVDGTARAGEDYTALNGTLTFLAGQVEASVRVAVSGDYDLEADETFMLSFMPTDQVANGMNPIDVTATILTDDFQNSPTAAEDSYTVAAGTFLTVTTASGVLANDFDVEGQALTASLVQGPSKGNISLNPDGSFTYAPSPGKTGTDQFTYRAFDGIAFSNETVVGITIEEDAAGTPGEFLFEVNVPETLAPGTAGPAQISYERGTPDGESLPINAALFFVTGQAALVQDPLTGSFDDQVFLLSYGDGVGDIAVGETGSSELVVKGTAGPRADYTVSASIIDFDAVIDWDASIDLLRPAGITNTAWTALSSLMIERLGSTGADFANVLAEYGQKLQTFGLNGESASAALVFLTEVVGDFGSIASRAAPGSMGEGWATLADIGLSFEGDTVILKGLPELSLLRTLNPNGAAFYTISESASRASTLAGSVVSAVPISGIQFIETKVGTYASTSLTEATLVETSGGLAVEYLDGARLLFDASGAFLKLVEADGREITASRDTDGVITGFAGSQGSAMTFTRNADGNIQRIADAKGSSIDLVYDGAGRLISATSDMGTAEFGYDASGNLISVKAPGTAAAQITYDPGLRLASIDYASGLQTEAFTYDGVGGVTVTDGESRATTIDYLPRGVVGRVTDGEGNVSSLIFDEDGDLVGLRAPDGTETAFTFDDLGRITSLTDANGATVSFGYVGNSEAPATFTDAGGSTRTFTYNEGGRITEAQWADGTSLKFSYDIHGNLVMSENRRGESIDYTYDGSGRLIAQSSGSSGAVAYGYDGQGRFVSAVDGRGTTSFEYDGTGRITKITYPEGRSLSYTYNEAGLRTSMTDQSGDALFYEYDNLGRLIGLDDTNGAIVDYTYDTAGNLIREENGNGTVSTFAYDDVNRLTEIINAQSGGTVNSFYRYTYDTAGQRVEMESYDGTWSYGYDAIGQLTSANFVSINPLIADKSLVYEYDGAGNRIRVVEDGAETLYIANALNQYTRVGNVTFTYDDDGNMVSKTDPSGTTTYAYDLNNRLVQVVEADGSVHEHEYDVLGNRVSTTTDGVRTEFLMDPFGFGNVVGDYASDGTRSAEYVYGLGLTSAEVGGSIGYYDVDGVGSVGTLTGADGTIANSYSFDPFGQSLLEFEMVNNRYEFNGLFGVSEDADGSVYMRARNYNPTLGRFYNEDPYWYSENIYNLYEFGENNPNLFVDPGGGWIQLVIGILTVAAVANEVVEELKQKDEERGNRFVDEKGEPNPNVGYALDPRALIDAAEAFTKVLIEAIKDRATGKVFDKVKDKLPQKMGGAIDAAGEAKDIKDIFDKIQKDEIKQDSGNNNDAGSSVGRGDPWISSFDGRGTAFNAVGEFVYARSDDGQFEVQARQLPYGTSTTISNIYAAATRIGDNKVEIQWTGAYGSLVLVNGLPISIEVGESVAVDDGSIYRSSDSSYVISNGLGDGMAVHIGRAFMDVYPFIDPSRAGEVRGIHGNYDGDHTNDFALPDGTVLSNVNGGISFQELYTTFADAWRVTDDTSLFTYLTGQVTADFTDLSFPRGLIRLEDLDPDAVAQARAIAIAAGLEPGTWLFETTVFDIAFTGDSSYAETSASAPDFAFTSPDGSPVQIVTPGIDAPPILDGITATVGEDGSVVIDVLASAADPEDRPLTLVSGSDPSGGTVTIDDGKLVFVPAPDFEGETVLTYLIQDEAGNEVEGTVPVTVTGVPDAPIAVDDGYVMTAGTVLDIAPAAGLLANDSDADGDQLLVTAFDAAANGTLLVAADGAFNYTPNAGFSGQETIGYTISDGSSTATATLKITVEPQVSGITVNAGDDAVIDEGDTFTRSISFTDGEDANADGWTYSVDWGDGSVAETGSIAAGASSFDISRLFVDGDASHDVTVTVTDAEGDSDTRQFRLDVNNVAPVIALAGAAAAEAGASYTLSLGTVADPGVDTVSSYIIDWGDGSPAQTVAEAGDITHVYTDAGDRTIAVSLVDEDGTHIAGTLAVQVGAMTPTLSLDAGRDAAVDEGSIFARTINFSDGQDNGAAGWSYTADYGDGTVVSGDVLAQSIELSHVYADGGANHTISLTVRDETGESITDSFGVTVNNVAPVASILGADETDEGDAYVLQVGPVTDPGADTRSGYGIDWGDGVTESFTAAQWVAAAGSFSHVYADGAGGGTARTITVSATDEDGTFILGSKTLTVHNVAPALVLGGSDGDVLKEGDTHVLSITGADAAGADDTLRYRINWGDGTTEQILTAAQLAALGGNVGHVYADDEDGPGNSTARTIVVEADDGDGGITTQSRIVQVDNVAPDLNVTGSTTGQVGQPYELTLSSLVDPGIDTLVQDGISVDWGDGTVTTHDALGDITHVYSGSGAFSISISLTDEDGVHTGVATADVNIVAPEIRTVEIGNAPDRLSGRGDQWMNAWTDADVSISHKADSTNAAEGWSAVKLSSLSSQGLAGGDVYAGDLGVSGQSAVTSTVRQEIDGKEGLRIDLGQEASALTLHLSRFFAQDDGTPLVESGRVRLLSEDGSLVGETVFHAGSLDGFQEISLASSSTFTAIELNAGAYDGSEFVFGGYANADGSFGSGIIMDGTGTQHGSDFLVDALALQFPVLGVPADAGDLAA